MGFISSRWHWFCSYQRSKYRSRGFAATIDNYIAFAPRGTERVRIDGAGNLGLGTTSPYAKLSVVGETVSTYFTATSTTATSTFPYLSVTTNSNLGTVVGGTWQGTAIGATYGGTRINSSALTVSLKSWPAHGRLLPFIHGFWRNGGGVISPPATLFLKRGGGFGYQFQFLLG